MSNAGALTAVDHTYPVSNGEPCIGRQRLHDSDTFAVVHFYGDFYTLGARDALFNCSAGHSASHRANDRHDITGSTATATDAACQPVFPGSVRCGACWCVVAAPALRASP